MKKHDLIYLSLLLIIGLVFMRFFFLPTFPSTHDGQNHLARLANLDLAVRDGHFPFRWAINLNHKFGYPVFNFNYYMPELLALFPFRLGFSFEASLKILIVTAYIFGSFFWYLFLRQYFKPLAAFCGGLFSLSAIYPLTIIWVRGSPGETLALALFPLIFLLIKLFSSHPNRLNLFLLTGVLFTLLLSHNITVLFGLPLIILFVLIQKQVRLINFLPLILSLGLSMFFWLPVVLEKQFTYLKYFDSLMFINHFPSLTQLIYSPWGFGYSIAGLKDGFSFQLGPFHWLAVLASIFLFFRLKQKDHLKKTFLFFGSIFGIYLFFTLPISGLFYRLLPFVNFIQYPWRLVLFLTLPAVFLAAWLSTHKPKLGLTLAILAVIYALFITKPQGGFNWKDDYYYLFPFNSTVGQEAMPIWFEEAKNATLFDSIERVYKADEVTIQSWRTKQHLYQVTINKAGLVQEKTAYFPGWELKVDGQKAKILYQDPVHPGLIGYQLSPGIYTIETSFTENTPARKLGDTISLISLGLLAFFLIKPRFW